MIVCTVVVIGGAVYLFNYEPNLFSGDEDQSTSQDAASESNCNVYAEKIHGTLDAYEPPEGSENYGNIAGSDIIVRNIKKLLPKGFKMKIIEVKGYNEMSKEAASLLIDGISKNPSLVIGFCNGLVNISQ